MLTYLFGAGASANALPVVSYFNRRLSNFKTYLDRVITSLRVDDIEKHKIYDIEFSELVFLLTRLHKDYADVLADLSDHSTIDNLAKRYFLNNQKESYDKVKRVIDSFIVFEQNYNTKWTSKMHGRQHISYPEYSKIMYLDKNTIVNFCSREPRMTSHFASLLRNSKGLDRQIRFLTWNYDSQIQLAYKYFIDNSEIDSQVIHLNGFANDFIRKIRHQVNFELNDLILLFELCNRYYGGVVSESSISFAWENHRSGATRINHAKKIMAQSRFLVIVGYSFPDVNLETDMQLLNSFIGNVSSSNRKQIRIIDPSYSAGYLRDFEHMFNINSLRLKFQASSFDRILEVSGSSMTNRFYIPPAFVHDRH